MASINIRGAKLQLVSATDYTATSSLTAISDLVMVESLPGTEGTRRNVTELDDTTESYNVGKLKKLSGELVYVCHVPATGSVTDRTGTSGILRLDIPTDGTSTSATTYVQVFASVAFTGHEPLVGDDETDVKFRVRAWARGALAYGTASY
jgi:hypothetical protein